VFGTGSNARLLPEVVSCRRRNFWCHAALNTAQSPSGAQMIFKRNASRRWRMPAAAAALVAAVVAGCGGGTTQYDPFVAGRVLAFGDDTSAMLPDGRRWGINGVDPITGAPDCNQEPNWVQSVAGYYGYIFAECNTSNPPLEAKGLMFAAVTAKVSDVATQVEAMLATGGVRDKDLALVMAGTNDVWELYEQYPSQSEETLIADIRGRADQLAGIVNRLVALGAKVVVVNLPDLGLSPYARTESDNFSGTGFDRAALITRLTTAFNERLGTKVLLDGRYVGLVQLDLRTQAIGRSPQSFGFTDISTAVCTVLIPNCTPNTLVTGATVNTYLWADDKHLSSGGQSQIATLALDRVRRNPF
jgi:outer membrane lipase/esterase